MTKVRLQLREAISLEFPLGEAPVKERFTRLLDLMTEVLPGKIDRLTLEDSVRDLAGVPLTEKLIDETAWRLAGNTGRLAQHRPVPPWHGQRFREWVPAQILSCRREKNSRGVIGANLGFRILAGTPCPRIIFKWLTLRQCLFHAKDFGFSRRRGPNALSPPRFPYHGPEHLVNLRCFLMIEPELCTADGPGFDTIGHLPMLEEWNREVLMYRVRDTDGYECPNGYPRSLVCSKCPTGYLTCRAGTHKQDWVQKACAGCNQPDAWFDPDFKGDVCVDCVLTNLYKRKQS